MSGWNRCTCDGTWEEKRKNWIVVNRNCNYSHFERPKGCRHYSEYSLVACTKCTGLFRTKARYVFELPDGELE